MQPRVLQWREPKEAFARRQYFSWFLDIVFPALILWWWFSLARREEGWHFALFTPVVAHALWLTLTPHIRNSYMLSAAGIRIFPGRGHQPIAWQDLESFVFLPPATLQFGARRGGKLKEPNLYLDFDPQQVSADSLRRFISTYLPETDFLTQARATLGLPRQPRLASQLSEAIKHHNGTVAPLCWKEPPPEKSGPQWWHWHWMLPLIYAIGLQLFTKPNLPATHISIVAFGIFLLSTKPVCRKCRIDQEGISLVHTFQRRQVLWRQIESIIVYQRFNTPFCEITITGKHHWNSLILRTDTEFMSDEELRASIREIAPSVRVV